VLSAPTWAVVKAMIWVVVSPAICAVVKPAISAVMLISGKANTLQVSAEQPNGILTRRPSHICNSIFSKIFTRIESPINPTKQPSN